MSAGPIPNQWLEVTYVRIQVRLQEARAGGSGSKRIWLSDLVTWLAENPGVLIVSMRELG